jgi:tetratricopeptide (TPR) repeat protein
MKKLWPLILLIYVLAISVHYQVYNKFRHSGSSFTQLLYLPSGKYLKPASFGYYALLADFVYLWSIQYYGAPQFSPRMEYLKHTYEIITELDPNYIDAYQTGALFMFFDGRNPQAGLALLDKGLQKNPHEWIIPADAGFYCMITLKDYRKAAEYFKKASAVPGAPSQAKRLLAGMHFRMGDQLHAYELWKEVYETAAKPQIKQTAYQHMHDLKVLIDVDAMKKALVSYQLKNNRYPFHLQQLVNAGLIKEIPLDPDGAPYLYDQRTGEVKYSKELNIYKRFQ